MQHRLAFLLSYSVRVLSIKVPTVDIALIYVLLDHHFTGIAKKIIKKYASKIMSEVSIKSSGNYKITRELKKIMM